jgi:SAM-dependent methyltransferase
MGAQQADARHELIVMDANSQRNKDFYDEQIAHVETAMLVDIVRNVNAFLTDAIHTDTSWVAMYCGNFRGRLNGARVLELGSGNGLNALIMAALGARVVCIDLSDQMPRLVHDTANALGLRARVEAIAGDFVDIPLEPRSFDLVVGKAFLHHLTHEQESRYLEKAAAVLRPDGQARFTEPAVNSEWLDALRWMVAVPGRPSRLQGAAFAAYRAADPHPVRDNSSAHYARSAYRFFEEVRIVPIGGLERFHRLLPDSRFTRPFRRAAFRAEHWLPYSVHMKIARGQTLLFDRPRRNL